MYAYIKNASYNTLSIYHITHYNFKMRSYRFRKVSDLVEYVPGAYKISIPIWGCL